MVCEKCEQKLGVSVTADTWKSGSRSTVGSETGKQKLTENKFLTRAKGNRFDPTKANYKLCRICRVATHHPKAHYCQSCSYKKSICCMCGKTLMSTKNYKMSST